MLINVLIKPRKYKIYNKRLVGLLTQLNIVKILFKVSDKVSNQLFKKVSDKILILLKNNKDSQSKAIYLYIFQSDKPFNRINDNYFRTANRTELFADIQDELVENLVTWRYFYLCEICQINFKKQFFKNKRLNVVIIFDTICQ